MAVTVGSIAGEAVLTVKDSGIEISAELLPHVFEVFVQGATSLDRAQGGLGIGLALVKQLVSLHGGTVSAESDGPGRGSTFAIRPPRIAKAVALPVATLPASAGRRRWPACKSPTSPSSISVCPKCQAMRLRSTCAAATPPEPWA